MAKVKICANCAHVRYSGIIGIHCARPVREGKVSSVDLVTGETLKPLRSPCFIERKDDPRSCGPDGKFYKSSWKTVILMVIAPWRNP